MREAACQHRQRANLRGKAGLVSAPFLFPTCLYPFLPFPWPCQTLSPWVPASPPLEGGAWLHPRVLELYAPSRQRSWGEWHPAGGSGSEAAPWPARKSAL